MKRYFTRIGLLLSVILITYDVAGQHGWSVNPSDYSFTGEVVAVVLDGSSELTTGTLGAFIRDSCRGYSDGIIFPPTGKTVFIVMCYSFRASGDTITFKYFDPSDNSTHNIVETVIFEEDMIVGNAETPEQFHICYPVSIVSQPINAAMCAGADNASFSVVTAGSPVFDYQWQYNNGSEWLNVVNGTPSGAVYTNPNTSTLGITGITSAGNYRYRCYVTNCNAYSYDISDEATLTVYPASVGGTISGSTTVCSGTNNTTLTLAGYVGTITKWQRSVSPFTTWIDISNTNSTLNATNLTVTTRYRAVITSGVCPAVNSGEATITVSPTSVGGTISGSTTVCSGINSTTLTLTGYTGTITKWQSSVSPFTMWADISNTTVTLTATNLTVTTKYRVVVTSGACPAANSEQATVTVNPLPATGLTVGGTGSVCSGTGTNITVAGSVVGTRYQLRSGPTPVGTTVAGTGDVINLPTGNLTATTTFNVLATITSTGCSAQLTQTATVTVNPLPATGLTVGGTGSVCSGTGTNITVAGSLAGTRYQLRSGTTPVGTAVNGTGSLISLPTGNLAATTTFNVLATITATGCSAQLTQTATVIVNPNPTAITGTKYVSVGSTTTLSSTPTGGTWTSSNTGVASVNPSTGVVTGISSGTAIITYKLLTNCLVTTVFNVLPAGWNVNPGYTYNGLVTAKVIIGGTPVESGFLAAFVGDECQGVVETSYYEPSNHFVFRLTCYSDKASGDVLIFKYYDPVANAVYNMDRSVDFIPGMLAGTQASPIIMNVGVEYSVSFPVGWSWFSVNNTLDNMSLKFILSSVNTPGDYIKSQVSTATYYSGYGWFGPLTELNPSYLYKLKVQNARVVNFSGRTVNVSSTNIPVVSGWNWIGYLPQGSQPLNTALSSLNLAHLDYIKNQFNTATYYSGYGWFGQLETLSPKLGYMLKLSNAGTLKYSESGKTETLTLPSSKGSELDFDPYSFEYNGSMTAKVLLEGVPLGSEDDTLYAYVGEEIRGVAGGQYFAPTKTWLYTLMVYSNVGDGEIINLGFYDAQNDKYLLCEETVSFRNDMVLNDAFNPFIVNIDASSVSVPEHDFDDLSLRIYPNPFETSLNLEYNLEESVHMRIAVYDIYGKMLSVLVDQKQDPGSYMQKWNPDIIAGGTYFIKLQAGKRQTYRKVIFIK